ncbi:cell filamentation protein Fic [Quadrisphaera sp. GCM10027208]|uniref:cell filamentation protein Fic n=1 Tax=Quadrisphaera sp. GCM10027208 TaxID=3273423 RepID=UPI0036092187
MSDPLAALAGLPGVADAVAEAREACERLRWHPAMRRRAAECRVEAGVRAARCSAALDGGRLPLELVRDAARGARELPDDPAGIVVRGALRAHAETERLAADGGRGLTGAPWQALARLHLAAAAGLVPDDQLGRPRGPGERPRDVPAETGVPGAAALASRLDGLRDLLSAPTEAPALVVAAVAHAEVLTLRPFTTANGVVARAVQHAVVVGRGLDPMGVAVPEAAHLSDANGYVAAAAGYASGTREGVAAWIRHCAWAVVAGAGEGTVVADAVLAGRLPR